MSKFRNYWLGLPIGSKMKAFIVLLLLVVLIAAGFNIYTIQFSVVDISNILEEISRCENAQDAMTNEEAAFHVFVRDPSVESLSDLNKAAVHSHSALSLLPYDYEESGAERFAWTWRVKQKRLSELFFSKRPYLRESLRVRLFRAGFRAGVGRPALSGI